MDTCLRKILIERDVQGAIDYCKGTISDLLQNKMDISMLVISKSLGKSADDADYANKQGTLMYGYTITLPYLEPSLFHFNVCLSSCQDETLYF